MVPVFRNRHGMPEALSKCILKSHTCNHAEHEWIGYFRMELHSICFPLSSSVYCCAALSFAYPNMCGWEYKLTKGFIPYLVEKHSTSLERPASVFTVSLFSLLSRALFILVFVCLSNWLVFPFTLLFPTTPLSDPFSDLFLSLLSPFSLAVLCSPPLALYFTSPTITLSPWFVVALFALRYLTLCLPPLVSSLVTPPPFLIILQK